MNVKSVWRVRKHETQNNRRTCLSFNVFILLYNYQYRNFLENKFSSAGVSEVYGHRKPRFLLESSLKIIRYVTTFWSESNWQTDWEARLGNMLLGWRRERPVLLKRRGTRGGLCFISDHRVATTVTLNVFSTTFSQLLKWFESKSRLNSLVTDKLSN